MFDILMTDKILNGTIMRLEIVCLFKLRLN